MKSLSPLFEVKGGVFRIFEDDEVNFVGQKTPATLAGDITFTWPGAMPVANGYVMACTMAGVMSWFGLFEATNTWTGLNTYTTNGIKFNFTNAGDTIFTSYLGANAQPSLQVTGDGSMFWGPGSGIVDVVLSRTSAGVLNITGNLDISGLTASRVLATSSTGLLVSVGAPGSDGYVLSSTVAGVLSWIDPGGSSSADLSVGTGISIVAGTGSGAVLTEVTLAVNQGASFTWTGKHTHTMADGEIPFAVRQTGDTNDRLYLYTEGDELSGIYWSDGSSAWDCGLVRTSERYLSVGHAAGVGGFITPVGGTNQQLIFGGIVHTDYTTVTATASEVTLHTFTLDGNAFYSDGDTVWIESFGTSNAAAGVGVPRVDLYFNGTSYGFFTGGAAPGGAMPYHLKATFVRQSSSELAYVISAIYGLTFSKVASGTITSLDFTTSKEIKTTGQSTDGSNVPREFAFICGYSSAGIS